MPPLALLLNSTREARLDLGHPGSKARDHIPCTFPKGNLARELQTLFLVSMKMTLWRSHFTSLPNSLLHTTHGECSSYTQVVSGPALLRRPQVFILPWTTPHETKGPIWRSDMQLSHSLDMYTKRKKYEEK